MKMVKNPVSRNRSVACSLGVPEAVELDIIESDNCPSPDEAVGNYWRNTVPEASWEMMAHALYQNNEETALEAVKTEYLTEVNVIKG